MRCAGLACNWLRRDLKKLCDRRRCTTHCERHRDTHTAAIFNVKQRITGARKCHTYRCPTITGGNAKCDPVRTRSEHYANRNRVADEPSVTQPNDVRRACDNARARAIPTCHAIVDANSRADTASHPHTTADADAHASPHSITWTDSNSDA
jgi:hypothetical protein